MHAGVGHRVSLQAPEGLCWLSSVLLLLHAFPYGSSPNRGLVECLDETRRVSRWRRVDRRKLRRFRANEPLVRNWQLQAYLFVTIQEHLCALEAIRPKSPTIKWSVRAHLEDMPSEYALVCLFCALGRSVALWTEDVDGRVDTLGDSSADVRVWSRYFERGGAQRGPVAPVASLYELAVGESELHSVVLDVRSRTLFDPNFGPLAFDRASPEFVEDIRRLVPALDSHRVEEGAALPQPPSYVLRGLLCILTPNQN